jgi:hypothetical protein
MREFKLVSGFIKNLFNSRDEIVIPSTTFPKSQNEQEKKEAPPPVVKNTIIEDKGKDKDEDAFINLKNNELHNFLKQNNVLEISTDEQLKKYLGNLQNDDNSRKFIIDLLGIYLDSSGYEKFGKWCESSQDGKNFVKHFLSDDNNIIIDLIKKVIDKTHRNTRLFMAIAPVKNWLQQNQPQLIKVFGLFEKIALDDADWSGDLLPLLKGVVSVFQLEKNPEAIKGALSTLFCSEPSITKEGRARIDAVNECLQDQYAEYLRSVLRGDGGQDSEFKIISDLARIYKIYTNTKDAKESIQEKLEDVRKLFANQNIGDNLEMMCEVCKKYPYAFAYVTPDMLKQLNDEKNKKLLLKLLKAQPLLFPSAKINKNKELIVEFLKQNPLQNFPIVKWAERTDNLNKFLDKKITKCKLIPKDKYLEWCKNKQLSSQLQEHDCYYIVVEKIVPDSKEKGNTSAKETVACGDVFGPGLDFNEGSVQTMGQDEVGAWLKLTEEAANTAKSIGEPGQKSKDSQDSVTLGKSEKSEKSVTPRKVIFSSLYNMMKGSGALQPGVEYMVLTGFQQYFFARPSIGTGLFFSALSNKFTPGVDVVKGIESEMKKSVETSKESTDGIIACSNQLSKMVSKSINNKLENSALILPMYNDSPYVDESVIAEVAKTNPEIMHYYFFGHSTKENSPIRLIQLFDELLLSQEADKIKEVLQGLVDAGYFKELQNKNSHVSTGVYNKKKSDGMFSFLQSNSEVSQSITSVESRSTSMLSTGDVQEAQLRSFLKRLYIDFEDKGGLAADYDIRY